MSSRRIIILIVAVVVGILASASVYTYVNNVKNEAAEGTQMVEVWRVVEVIPKGTSGEAAITQEFIVKESIEVAAKPTTAIDDPEAVITGLVAIIDIPPNMTLVEGLFVEPGVLATGITDRLEERKLVTMTFQVDAVAGVAGMIEPGDRINIIVTGDREGGSDESSGGTSSNPEEGGTPPDQADGNSAETPLDLLFPRTGRYLYQYVEVLAVGQNLTSDLGAATTADGEAAPAAPAGGGGMLTVAVPPEAVAVLLSADPGRFYISLVPQNYVPIPLIEGIDFGEDENMPLYPGERSGSITPYPETNESLASLGVTDTEADVSEDK